MSLHALCALNIYFGGSKTVSQFAYGEFIKNLTYQALSQENDDIFCPRLTESTLFSTAIYR